MWYVMETSTTYNQYAARIPKGMGVVVVVGVGGVVSSLSLIYNRLVSKMVCVFPISAYAGIYLINGV